MNREVHVRFWESVGMRFPALLDYLHDYDTVADVEEGLGRFFPFYNGERLHQSLDYRTPAAVHWQRGAMAGANA